jgi:predicted short-subunit dehydrogenase-like oxidoreductase (DUF2520 family)
VRSHLRVLGDIDQDLAETYRVLAGRTARRASAAGLLPEQAAAEVMTTLRENP